MSCRPVIPPMPCRAASTFTSSVVPIGLMSTGILGSRTPRFGRRRMRSIWPINSSTHLAWQWRSPMRRCCTSSVASRGKSALVPTRLAQSVTEHGFSYYHAWATIMNGWAVAEEATSRMVLHVVRVGVRDLRATGAELRLPHYLGDLADLYCRAQRLDDAIVTLAEARAVAERNEEHWADAVCTCSRAILPWQSVTKRRRNAASGAP